MSSRINVKHALIQESFLSSLCKINYVILFNNVNMDDIKNYLFYVS